MSLRLPNTCFVHIPRTGGTWLRQVITNLGILKQYFGGDIDSHFSYKQLPDNWKELESFTIIRHPFSWVKSRWSHVIEISAYQDYRHYGIHRVFDECVRNTLQETLEVIIKKHPRLVYNTFKEMSEGVKNILTTEKLPDNVYEFLSKYENVTRFNWNRALCEKFNNTSDLPKFQHLTNVSSDILNDFLISESETIKWWESCG